VKENFFAADRTDVPDRARWQDKKLGLAVRGPKKNITEWKTMFTAFELSLAALDQGPSRTDHYAESAASRSTASCQFGSAQTKLAASSMLPDPLYFATLRVRAQWTRPDNLISVNASGRHALGALPCSTQAMTGASGSNDAQPTPPEQ
jgi:hypothetical protein